MSDDVALVVKGRRYAGWKSIRITLSIETVAGSFALEVSDRWDGTLDPWPIVEQDPCRVEIGGVVVIDGYIKTRDISADATTRTLSYSGKDRAAEIVECSLLVKGAGENKNKWTYRNIDIAQFATEIAKSHGIKVRVQAGLALKKDPLLVAHPGETGWEALRRVVGSSGVLVVSDGAGGILITRAGNARATSLIEGSNILRAAVRYDGSDRFHTYLISSQIPGTDDASGDATRVQAEATDDGVSLESRVLLIRPDKGYGKADARRRADWEARIRAARAETVMVTVQGWRQPNGALWSVNALSRVTAPRSIGVDGDLLISEVEYSIGEGGQITQMRLVRPDAFEPEPQATVKSAGELWLIKGKDGELVEPGGRR
jgi:prophage tail gpP-like protein